MTTDRRRLGRPTPGSRRARSRETSSDRARPSAPEEQRASSFPHGRPLTRQTRYGYPAASRPISTSRGTLDITNAASTAVHDGGECSRLRLGVNARRTTEGRFIRSSGGEFALRVCSAPMRALHFARFALVASLSSSSRRSRAADRRRPARHAGRLCVRGGDGRSDDHAPRSSRLCQGDVEEGLPVKNCHTGDKGAAICRPPSTRSRRAASTRRRCTSSARRRPAPAPAPRW